MTVEPAFTRANRINSDSLDWSYIGTSITVGISKSAPVCEAPIHGSLTGDRGRASLGPATGLLKTKARVARKHGSRIAVANAADKIRPDSRAGKEDIIHASV